MVSFHGVAKNWPPERLFSGGVVKHIEQRRYPCRRPVRYRNNPLREELQCQRDVLVEVERPRRWIREVGGSIVQGKIMLSIYILDFREKISASLWLLGRAYVRRAQRLWHESCPPWICLRTYRFCCHQIDVMNSSSYGLASERATRLRGKRSVLRRRTRHECAVHSLFKVWDL